MAQSVVTPPATLCFPALFQPKPRAQGKDPDYSCILLFDQKAQSTQAYAQLKAAVMECIRERWPTKANDPNFIRSLNLPFKDAAEKDKYDGFEAGKIFISPWCSGDKGKPEVVDVNGDDIMAPQDVFAGQIVRASVRPYAYPKEGAKGQGVQGVSLWLESVQVLIAEMPRIDGKVNAKDKFGKAPIEGLELPTKSADGFPF